MLIPALLLASLGSRFSSVSVCVFVWVSACECWSLPKPEALDLLELEI